MSTGSDGGPLDAFEVEIAELKDRAERAARAVAACVVTESAPNGSVSVTVGPGGNLLDITFGARARVLPPQELSLLVMKLVGKAQQQAAAQVRTAFEGLVGDGSDAMDVLSGFWPVTEHGRQPTTGVPRSSRPGTPTQWQRNTRTWS